EGRRAEVDVAGVAAENVPRGGDDDILEHNVPREVDVLVHAERGDDDPSPDDGQADEERAGGPRHHLPRSRAGRTARATGRRPEGAMPTPKAMVLIWTGSAPINRSARRSWDTAMTARP